MILELSAVICQTCQAVVRKSSGFSGARQILAVVRQSKVIAKQAVVRWSSGNYQAVVEKFSEKSKVIQFILFFEPSAISKSMPSNIYDIFVITIYLNLLRLLKSCNGLSSRGHKTLPNQPLSHHLDCQK